MKPQGYVPPSAPPSAHEGADLHVPIILKTAAVIGCTLGLLIVAVTLFFHILNRVYPHRTSEALPIVTTADLPPEPRLQTDPDADMQRLRAAEDVHLEHYAWMDRTQGVAQIPIDRAMVLWAKSYAANPPAVPATNAVPAATELEMRQAKALEGRHAP